MYDLKSDYCYTSRMIEMSVRAASREDIKNEKALLVKNHMDFEDAMIKLKKEIQDYVLNASSKS